MVQALSYCAQRLDNCVLAASESWLWLDVVVGSMRSLEEAGAGGYGRLLRCLDLNPVLGRVCYHADRGDCRWWDRHWSLLHASWVPSVIHTYSDLIDWLAHLIPRVDCSPVLQPDLVRWHDLHRFTLVIEREVLEIVVLHSVLVLSAAIILFGRWNILLIQLLCLFQFDLTLTLMCQPK